MNELTVDAIISYVNPSDKLWASDYSKATGNYNVTGPRFRSWGTLKYLFRAIAENMPFVNNVVLIVARESQVPDWVNKENVRVVYHKDFIPKEFLPTFNSCTIESFFWNIPNLSEKIIYFNDDMFATNPLTIEDFFTKDAPHLYFGNPEGYSKKNIFRCQCRTGMDMICNVLSIPTFEPNVIIKPPHVASPITRESLIKVHELCEKHIKNSVSMLRKPSNVNQYIYSYYQYFTNNYVCASPAFAYFEIKESTIAKIEDAILSKDYQLVCINDSGKLRDYKQLSYQLQECFESKFPNQCKYEF